jgi:hypothetical protein
VVPELLMQVEDDIGSDPLDELEVRERRVVGAQYPIDLEDVER